MSDTTIRVNKRENPFTQIDRQLINDRRLSLDTRFMLIWLLDKPPKWKTTIGSLVNQLPAGRSVVRRMIEESEELGYIQRIESRDKGRFVYSYEVFDHPTKEELTSPCAVNRVGSTASVQPRRFNRVGSTASANRPLINTEYSNTELNNTDFTDTDHHHQTQPPAATIPNDDDDGLKSEDSAMISPHLKLAETITEHLPAWTGSKTFLRGLNEAQQIAAASWLYLWYICNSGDDWEAQQNAIVARSQYKHFPFDGVDNVIGKIITQARSGNIAPLSAEHRESFAAEIKSIFEDLAQPA